MAKKKSSPIYVSIGTPENDVKALVQRANKDDSKKYKYKKVKTTIGYMWAISS